MEVLAGLLARFDSLALPWQLMIVAGLAAGVVVVLVGAQATVRREGGGWDRLPHANPRALQPPPGGAVRAAARPS